MTDDGMQVATEPPHVVVRRGDMGKTRVVELLADGRVEDSVYLEKKSDRPWLERALPDEGVAGSEVAMPSAADNADDSWRYGGGCRSALAWGWQGSR